jgi:murein endopeptidase
MRAAVLCLVSAAACSPAARPKALSLEDHSVQPPRAAAHTAPSGSSATTPIPSTEAPDTGYPEAEEHLLDDGAEAEAPPAVTSAPAPHPLDGKTREELEALLVSDPTTLGSMSVGSTNGGSLFNGVQLPVDDRWVLADAANTWGTRETVDFLVQSISKVHERFPGTPPLHIGHISARRGGHLSPHVSHQAGRDVDIGYYYTDGARWYAFARASNLDRPRTWALVRAMISDSDVELILIDHSIQKLLEDYAREIGEDQAWLDSVFRGVPGKLPPIIRHANGHATHLHVRFFNPIAQETARRLAELMIRHKKMDAPVGYVQHKVKNGETLGMLARKYKTTVRAIQRANGLRSTKIRAKKVYMIPRPGQLKLPSRPLSVPPRRLPPTNPPSREARL